MTQIASFKSGYCASCYLIIIAVAFASGVFIACELISLLNYREDIWEDRISISNGFSVSEMYKADIKEYKRFWGAIVYHKRLYCRYSLRATPYIEVIGRSKVKYFWGLEKEISEMLVYDEDFLDWNAGKLDDM